MTFSLGYNRSARTLCWESMSAYTVSTEAIRVDTVAVADEMYMMTS